MIGVVSDEPIVIVEELMPLGSMLNFLRKNKSLNIDWRLWAFQIADGMNYLSSKNIVHRNLAARNILLESTEQVKISDFEISCILKYTDKYYHEDNQLVKWMSPELLSTNPLFSSASDVWSFGVTLWEMMSKGDEPYQQQNVINIAEFILNGGRLLIPDCCPLEIFEMMQKCWADKPCERPTFSELLNFFRNWEIRDVVDESIFTESDKDHLLLDDQLNANIETISKSLPDKIINIKDLNFEEQISVGEFGVVHKGTFYSQKLKLSIPVAIKTIKKENINTMQDQFLREFAVMTKLEHPNIIKLIGT